MGRFAQRARRGGAPPSPPVNRLPAIVSITANGTVNLIVAFDALVTTVPGSPTSDLVVSGEDTAVASGATSTVVAVVATSVVDPGEAWTLVSQPPWLITPVTFPAAGVTV